MLKIQGSLLNKTTFKTKKGNLIPKITILSNMEKYSRLYEIVDFDNQVNGTKIGIDIEIPVNQKVTVKDGRAYVNWAVAGPPEEIKANV